MEVREALEGKEYSYAAGGFITWRCPVCGTTWMQEDDNEEGIFPIETCDHLRFSLGDSSSNDIDFYGEWDKKGFAELIEKIRSEEGEVDILEILGKIQHPDVDTAIFYIFRKDPLYQLCTIWGYNQEALDR